MMKGWILIGLAAGAIYYLATETDKLDKPIAEANSVITKIERKMDSMTGTKIIKADRRIQQLKSTISERLSKNELLELDNILNTPEEIEYFKSDFCSSSKNDHAVFSKGNLEFICDSL